MSEFSLDVINKNRKVVERIVFFLSNKQQDIIELKFDLQRAVEHLNFYKGKTKIVDTRIIVNGPETDEEVCSRLKNIKKELDKCQEKQKELERLLNP